MKNTRVIVGIGATALLFGCSAGVKPSPTGTAGTGPGAGGTTGSAGTTGTAGSSATGTAGSGSGFDAAVDISVSDTKSDGVCSATTTAAEPLPLDLYFIVDVSKSMTRPTAFGSMTPKWDAVRSAMNAFFADSQSMGIGAGLGYFPALQPSLASVSTCTMDNQCGTYGPCDRRKTCVQTGKSTTVVTPLCVDNTTCPTNNVCALIQDCGEPNYCAADAPGTCPTPTCKEYAGYCHGRDICDVTAYATPVVPIAALSGTTAGQAATLMTSLTGRVPDGYTPTAPALKGAIQYAQQYAQSHAGHKLAVVLVTDGLPLGFTDVFDTAAGVIKPGFPRAECNPIDIPGIAAIAMAGAKPAAATTPAVPTFVIGIPSQAESSVIGPMLNQIATGGGTAPAILIDTSMDVSTVLRAKLAEIRTKAISCEYKIPSTGVDPGKVNVSFTNGSGQASTVGHAMADGSNGSGCDARGGWYYDTADPMTNPPTKITACPTTCSMFQTDLNGHVDVVLGCPTISVD